MSDCSNATVSPKSSPRRPKHPRTNRVRSASLASKKTRATLACAQRRAEAASR